MTNEIRIYSTAIKDARNMLVEKGHLAKVGDRIESNCITHIDSFGSYDAFYFNMPLKRTCVTGELLAVHQLINDMG